MQRAGKEVAIGQLQGIFSDFPVVLMLRHRGLTVSELEALREKARLMGGGFKVTKNRLAKIAIDGTPNEVLRDRFEGQTGIIFGDDIIATTKTAVGVAKTYAERVELEVCAYESRLLSKAEIEVMSRLPSMDELRGRIAGLLGAPLVKLVRVLSEPPSSLARLLSRKED